MTCEAKYADQHHKHKVQVSVEPVRVWKQSARGIVVMMDRPIKSDEVRTEHTEYVSNKSKRHHGK